MRKISINTLTSDMELAKPVYAGSSMLLNTGVKDLDQFKRRLAKRGINDLYIEDGASEGIEVVDLVSPDVRVQCKDALKENFSRMEKDFSLDVPATADVAQDLFSEILSSHNVLYNLNEIGSIGDNTLDHSLNTTIYAICLARQLGYDESQIVELATGTLLHDVGKTVLDPDILFKPGKLDDDEFDHIKQHPLFGYDILRKNRALEKSITKIELFHHERVDGSGYPYGLQDGEIPESAKICAIVDVYEALTVKRCYHDAINPLRASEILTKEAGTKLDFDLVSVFLKNIAVYPTGSTVLLSNGQSAVIKEQNDSLPLRPVVRTIALKDGKYIPKDEIDLKTNLNITIVDSDSTTNYP